MNPRLTRREQDIVNAIVKGRSNKQIAEELGLQVQTVKNKLSTIYLKFGVRTRLELSAELRRTQEKREVTST